MTGDGKKSKKITKNKQSTASATASSAKSDMSDADTTDSESITRSDLEKILAKHLEPLKKSLNETIIKLQSDIDEIRAIADNALKLAQENEKKIDSLKQENNALKNQLADNTIHINSLEEKIESRTNRQLRKTLVFKGIPEKITTENTPGTSTKKRKGESWNETKDILSKTISEICDIHISDARGMIERCHRSNNSKNYKGTGPRQIFAAFHDWNDSEYVIEEFRQNNIDNPTCNIYGEQKFGPMTTMRRSQALLLRKQLKGEGLITSGYVAFPAKLMVKQQNGDYYMEKDFSKVAVTMNS